MTKVIVEVPTEKMQPFLHLVMTLGLDKHAIASSYTEQKKQAKKSPDFFRKISSKFLLFDWEFFNNELEFE